MQKISLQKSVIGNSIMPQILNEKISGLYKYVDDVSGDFLFGYVLRSNVSHGKIIEIDTSYAIRSPGVHSVLTSKDVPGLNAFGYFKPEQPVLCYDKVRYEGDALVAIAANTPEQALKAAEEVKVKIEPLPVISTISEALSLSAISIHESGNVAYTASYEKGDFHSSIENVWKIVDGRYHISPVKPMYLELESTIASYSDGILNLITTTQSPGHDKVQLSRILNLPIEKIKIESKDPGGAFGGKEEIHTQALTALLSIKSGKPVKITMTREESGRSTTRRHGYEFEIKTSLTKDYTLSGIYIKAIGDTGAYLSHGPGVLKVSGSHSTGPYFVPNVKFDGMLVYTNLPPAGGMRGYGASEVNFALERHIDRICREFGFDPFEFRIKNTLKEGLTDGTGVTPTFTVKAIDTMERARHGKLWSERNLGSDHPFIKVGYGIASGAKSTSYGLGGDTANVRMAIKDGAISVYFNTPDMGTNFRTAIAMIAANALSTDLSLIKIKNDFSEYPESGTQNASRSTFMIGNAVLKCSEAFKEKVKSILSYYPNWLDKETINELQKRGNITVEAQYNLPTPKEGVFGKNSDSMYSFITSVARVEVNRLTGKIRVTDIESYPEAGTIINPIGFMSQMEGGIIMSMGYAIMENLKVVSGKVIANNFTTYILPSAADMPKIFIHSVENYEPLGPYGAKGAGELPLVSVTPAIVNAIVDAIGKELSSIPVSMEDTIYKKLVD